MKITAIGLFVIGFALLLFAGVSYFALTPTPSPDALNNSPLPSGAIFSPTIALVVAIISATVGGLILRYGGRGYTEKTTVPPGKIRA